MKKSLILLLCIFISYSTIAQETKKEKKDSFLKEFYQDFLKYGTIYAAGDISNSYEPARKEYFVRTNDNGSIYSIPVVVDGTEYNPFDYRDDQNVEEEFISEYEPLDYNYDINIWDLNNED